MPVTIGTSTSQFGVAYPFQKKVFFANGRWWFFYWNGTNLGWRTSIDGISWSNFTIYGALSSGVYFSIWYDELNNKTCLVRNSGSALMYRQGTANADGTITWDADEVVATNYYVGTYAYPTICKDSSGYPWVAYNDGTGIVRVCKATATDGSTWGSTNSLWSGISSACILIIPLTDNKMMAIMVKTNSGPQSRLYDGTMPYNPNNWQNAVVINAAQSQLDHTFDAVVDGDNVHFVYTYFTGSYNIYYVKYTYGVGWGGLETVDSGASNYHIPSVTLKSLDKVRVCYALNVTDKYHCNMKYRDRDAGTWRTAVVIEANLYNDMTNPSYPCCSREANSGRSLFVWIYGRASPYTVRVQPFIHANVVGTTSSTIAIAYPFQKRCFYANGRWWVFYYNGSNFGWRTSLDGITWTAFTNYGAYNGLRFDIWYDIVNNKICLGRETSGIFYNQGTANSDGTITGEWGNFNTTTEKRVSTDNGNAVKVCKDSDGYPWVSWVQPSSPYNEKVCKATATDGSTWDTPTILWTNRNAGNECVVIIPLTARKMLAVSSRTIGVFQSRLYDGTFPYDPAHWAGAVNASHGTPYGYWYYDVIPDGDNAHLTFANSSDLVVRYVKYTYGVGWGSDEILEVVSSTNYQPTIVLRDTDKVRVFYFKSSTDLRYRDRDSGVWREVKSILTNLSTYKHSIASGYKYLETYGILLESESASPYDINFEWFNNLFYVNADDATYVEWTSRIGSSPYLNAIDHPNNYIEMVAVADARREGIFDFPNDGVAQKEIIGKVFLDVYLQSIADGDVYPTLTAYVWNGFAWNSFVVPTNTDTFAWKSVDITSALYDAFRVDACRVYLQVTQSAGNTLTIDCMRLRTLWTRTKTIPTEKLGGLDSYSRIKSIYRVITEKLGGLDSYSRIKSIYRVITEKLGGLDSYSRIKSIYRVITEKLGGLDSYSRIKSIYRVVTEKLGSIDLIVMETIHGKVEVVGKRVIEEIELLTGIKIPIMFSRQYNILSLLSDLSSAQLQEILEAKSDYAKAVMLDLFQMDLPINYRKLDESIAKLTASLKYHKDEQLFKILINLITLKEILDFLDDTYD
jgi:hypothetical protein